MATVKAPFNAQPAPRSPWRKRIFLLGVALVAALFALFWHPLTQYAETGASYGARVGCSCRFVGGRSLEDCRKDFEAGMELVTLSEDAAARSVTARFPLLASHTATYREGPGCQLEPWRN